jgi:hypothetical protein
MQQVLHLLIVDRDKRAALTASYGSRWLLPVVTCAERARAAPIAARWAAERGAPGEVAGQWLGRVTEDGIDWLVVVAAQPQHLTPPPPLEWTPLDTLSSRASLVDYQPWAIGRAVQHDALPSVSGPFGNLSWPEDVQRWIGRAAGSAVSSLTPYRVGAYEVVLGADCVDGRVYFKGLVEARAAEARLTQALAAAAPDSFARTIALERQADGSVWWLTAACPGCPGGDPHRAAQALARVQQRTKTADRRSLALPALDLEAAARWASELLGDSGSGAIVRRRCAQALRADVPAAWIPMDLDPANILVDAVRRVRFIDVDDSILGPAPLAMATLARRCADPTLYRTYERSWSPPLARLEWRDFEVAASVVESWLGWQRLWRNIERGEVFAPLDLVEARVRARLARAINAE